jgi:hypothetical protein
VAKGFERKDPLLAAITSLGETRSEPGDCEDGRLIA